MTMNARHHSPAALPDDVLGHVRTHFPPHDVGAALAALAAAVAHTGEAPSDRLLRSAAVGARGRLDSLKYYVGLLAIDWRDVVVAGEYDLIDRQLVRVRDLTLPIPPHSNGRD